MGYAAVMKDRFIATIKGYGFSFKTMLQARKRLASPKSAFYLIFLALPLVSAIFINDPISALTWLIVLSIYLPIMDAYAYAVVYGGG